MAPVGENKNVKKSLELELYGPKGPDMLESHQKNDSNYFYKSFSIFISV